ncbi:hypothetical protein BDN70DRAFT_881521 [Pholiota conissans]|uniref:Uncharacterized protein n=1 Tax=Pholiota conissans TaxID=109636 RepID=A0A9P5YZ38_9AGAR|nr:hypothetical protein BDN70DRAFT_881521 [Pholiota conissans]
MIIVEASDVDDAASTTRTLIPPLPKIPPHFIKLIALSIPLSLVALITCLIDLALNCPILAVPTILAFCLSFPYHTGAVLLAWLQKHQIASVLSFAPASPRSIAHAGLLAALWAVAAGFNIKRATDVIPERLYCFDPQPDNPFGSSSMECAPYFIAPAGAPALAAATALVEVFVLVTLVIICGLHWHRGKEDSNAHVEEALPSSVVGSETKVVSP